jgi:hypothetical protein
MRRVQREIYALRRFHCKIYALRRFHCEIYALRRFHCEIYAVRRFHNKPTHCGGFNVKSTHRVDFIGTFGLRRFHANSSVISSQEDICLNFETCDYANQGTLCAMRIGIGPSSGRRVPRRRLFALRRRERASPAARSTAQRSRPLRGGGACTTAKEGTSTEELPRESWCSTALAQETVRATMVSRFVFDRRLEGTSDSVSAAVVGGGPGSRSRHRSCSCPCRPCCCRRLHLHFRLHSLIDAASASAGPTKAVHVPTLAAAAAVAAAGGSVTLTGSTMTTTTTRMLTDRRRGTNGTAARTSPEGPPWSCTGRARSW